MAKKSSTKPSEIELVPVPITSIYRPFLETLLPILNAHNAYIAGGWVREAMMGHNDIEADDIDIFFRHRDSIGTGITTDETELVKALDELIGGAVEQSGTFWRLIPTEESITPIGAFLNLFSISINIVGMPASNMPDRSNWFYGQPDLLVKTFDFTVCCGYIESATVAYVHPDMERDREAKILNLVNETPPFHILANRLQRYIQKGCEPSIKTWVALAEQYQRSFKGRYDLPTFENSTFSTMRRFYNDFLSTHRISR